MLLADIINDSEDLMICDLAQTYGILDYKQIKPNILAALVMGLPQDSRIMLKISKAKLSYTDSVLALIFDCLQIIAFNQVHRYRKNLKRPESLYKKLMEDDKKDDYMTFGSPENYERWRKEHING